MVKHNINLQIETTQNLKLTEKHLKLIEEALNARFVDATFKAECFTAELKLNGAELELNSATATFSDWEIKAIKTFLRASSPVQMNEPTDRVKLHRLKAKLPKNYQIKSKRGSGYTLVKV